MPRPKKIDPVSETESEPMPDKRIRGWAGDWVVVPGELYAAIADYRRTHDHYEALNVIQVALYDIEINGVPA